MPGIKTNERNEKKNINFWILIDYFLFLSFSLIFICCN